MKDDPASRAAYRAFVRRHHPDRGGDVDTFVAGLAEFHAATGRKRGTQDRFSAPIVVVVRKRGLASVAHRLGQWRKRRRKTRVR
ncbi:hypothetical protein [Amycolatopsis orientalis]|uniref:hypothetical protein n=1 Tax=Amycolatopsis orientalis TaxID=31958 RepID=UPI0003FBF948|nr:hypothetical protein [Amycolatopsis orientalis]